MRRVELQETKFLRLVAGCRLIHKRCNKSITEVLKILQKSRFSGLLHRVVRWLVTNVSDALLPPSSRLKCVFKEMLSTVLLPSH